MTTASILHADLDAFYASVEQRDDPRLRGRPVVVGAGVVLAASYEAKRYGVRTAMPGQHARRLCPQAAVVPPRMSAYAQASRAVFEVFRQTTPLVEGLSIDEAFLDVGGLRRVAGSPEQIAAELRRAVRDRVGLPITVGVARTKFLAKVASQVAKPDGLLVVPASGELEFLHPLPVEMLWGVGPVTAQQLRERGIRTVAQVARLGEPTLVSLLGKAAGRHLHALAHNRDPRPVTTGRRRSSIGAQQALGQRPHSAAELTAIASGLVDRVTSRMRAAGRAGRTVTLRLRFGDYSRVSRARTLRQPTTDTAAVAAAVNGLLAAAMPVIEQRGATLLGVAVSNLERHADQQPTLPFADEHGHELDQALDAVRERFGSAAVVRATLLGSDLGPTVPLLPD